MNAKDRFDILAVKYLTNKLSAVELQELENFVVLSDNYQQKFKELVRLNTLVDQNLLEKNNLKELQKIIQKTKKRPAFKKNIGYVAVVLGLFFIAISINYYMNRKENYSLVVPNEDITLSNEKGDIKKIHIEDGIAKIEWLKVGHKTIYKNKLIDSSFQKTKYTLKTPFGKQINITLSDGTKVYLNSGSTIIYPNTFKEEKNRIVHLKGEAYFEVTKNFEKPFIVKTNLLNVRVLGTKFNVSSYSEDTNNTVVLVEGRVAVSTYNTKTPQTLILNPQQKAVVNKTTTKSFVLSRKSISENDLLRAISWKNRELIFKNDDFLAISKKLERRFNIKIISKNKKLNYLKFTGKFNKQNIFEILDAFRVHTPFTYKIEGNIIVIENKN